MGANQEWQSIRHRHLAEERPYATVSGHLTVSGEPQSAGGAFDFWHVPPLRWRIEVDGLLQYVNNGTRAYLQNASGGYRTVRVGAMPDLNEDGLSPVRLLGGPGSVLMGASPDVEVTVTEPTMLSGREVIPVVLSAASTSFYIAFDTATAIIMSVRVPEVGLTATIDRIDIDRVIDDDVFEMPADFQPSGSGIVRTVDLRHVEEMGLCTPRYWPDGVGHSAMSANAATGEVATTLNVPGFPILLRWRVGTLAMSERPEWQGYPARYDWSDSTWHWRLLSRTSIADDELRAIRDSFPEHR